MKYLCRRLGAPEQIVEQAPEFAGRPTLGGVVCDPMPSPMQRDVAEFIDGITHELGALGGGIRPRTSPTQ